MPKEKVELDHPMSAGGRRSPRRNAAAGASELFDKLDSGEIKPESESQVETEPEVEPVRVKSLKELLFFGSITHTFEVDGFHFRMSSLTHKQSREIATQLFLMPNEKRLAESNTMHAAAALDRINGMTIPEAYSELFDKKPEGLSDLEMSMEILSCLNTHLVGRILNEYFVMSDDNKAILSPKSDKDSKEVTEDVKK